MVATEMPDHEEACKDDDSRDLVHRPDDNLSVVAVLRPGVHLRGRTRPEALSRGVASPRRRHPLLLDRQLDSLLRSSDDPDIRLLHLDLDQGLAEAYTDRHERRADGKDTAEVESEGRQDAGRGRDIVRSVVAAPLRDLHGDQARRRQRGEGGRDPADRDADRPVAWREQLLHQPNPLRVLQQKVPARLRGDPEERTLLWQDQVLRDGRHDVLVDQHEEVFVLREQQQLVNETGLPRAAGAPGQQRILHIQPHWRLNRGSCR